MFHRTLPALLTFCSLACSTVTVPLPHRATQEISLTTLEDRIRGAWAGKMIGVSLGAPTEFKFLGTIIPEDKLPAWTDDTIKAALNQDDLYIQMSFAKVVDEKGIDASTDDFGAAHRDSKYSLWHANQAGRRALRRGVPATLSGTPQYNAHGRDISFQIDADFIGLMCPAQPNTAAELARRVGQILTWGDGTYGGVFVASMYSAAYFDTDPRRVVQAGLDSLPPESSYATVIRDVLRWSRSDPDWQTVWHRIQDKYGADDTCPYGAAADLNIDAKVNGAYVALGLIYGGGDFDRTITIATRCGQDSDCNPSTAAGIWGAMYGYKALPEKYTRSIPPIADEKFQYTNYSFNSITAATVKNAIEVTMRNRGHIEYGNLVVRAQLPDPVFLPDHPEVGRAVDRIPCDDPRWHFTGNWRRLTTTKKTVERIASAKGDSAEITFAGTGACIVGPYVGSGGTADVFVDGHLDRTIDVYPDERTRRASEAVWWLWGLPDGQHTVRLVVRGERFRDSNGSEIRIQDFVIYR